VQRPKELIVLRYSIARKSLLEGNIMIKPKDLINHAEGDPYPYQREYENDTYHGQGTLTLADGTIYKGGFQEGRLQGQED
jgi:hypothetical protein